MKRKPYWKLTTEELAEVTRQFDEPFVADQARPLSSEERETWNRVRRKKGRPKVGLGFKRVSVSLEQELLRRVTALAKKRRVSRSALIAQALEVALAHVENPTDE